jgi:proline dehydrogenase
MPLLRSAFIALSTNQPLRRFSENSAVGRRLSSRFVAGLEVEDALRITERLNNLGLTATLDSLGESVATEAEAHRAAEIYHRLLDAIATQKLKANISVKLTQMGLELSPDLAFTIASGLTEHARATNNFVRIDMEGSNLTQMTLDMVRHLHARERDPELSLSLGGGYPGADLRGNPRATVQGRLSGAAVGGLRQKDRCGYELCATNGNIAIEPHLSRHCHSR